MGELSILELTNEPIEASFEATEEADNRRILPEVTTKIVEHLRPSVEVEGINQHSLNFEIDNVLSSKKGNYDVKKLAKKAVKEGYRESNNLPRNSR